LEAILGFRVKFPEKVSLLRKSFLVIYWFLETWKSKRYILDCTWALKKSITDWEDFLRNNSSEQVVLDARSIID
jgi:hypothetical protein